MEQKENHMKQTLPASVTSSEEFKNLLKAAFKEALQETLKEFFTDILRETMKKQEKNNRR